MSVATIAPEASAGEAELKLTLEMDALEILTNEPRGQLRSSIRCLVEEQLPLAHRVVLGEVRWSPVQARIFLMLLARRVGHAADEPAAGLRSVDLPPILSRQALGSLAYGIAG